MSNIADKPASSIADKLQDLITAKQDIKEALIEKDVVITGGLSTYAEAIRSMYNGLDFSVIHYDDDFAKQCNELLQQDINDCIDEVDEWNPNNTSTRELFMKYGMVFAPYLDTSNVTDMRYMFDRCTNLLIIPPYNTSNVTNMGSMFRNCSSLIWIPLLDCGNVETFQIFDHYSYDYVYVRELGGFKDLGKAITKDYIAAASYKNVSFERAQNLSHTALLNVINNLYDISTQNKKLTLQLGGENLSKLSDEDIAIATNKGWIVSV